MFKIKVLTVGRLKEPWLSAALAEYEKRLQGRMEIEWGVSSSEVELENALLKTPHFIALHPAGDLLNSEALSKKLHTSLRWTFAIGGANGFSPQVLQRAAWRWSLSPLTFTHQMTRLILAEQLYRSLEISTGSPYHQ